MSAPKVQTRLSIGRARAAVRAVRAIERELGPLQKVDFSSGWPRGSARRRLEKFKPARVLENFAFLRPKKRRLINSKVIEALSALADLYAQDEPDEGHLLNAVELLRAGLDRFLGDLSRLYRPTALFLDYLDRVNTPPRRASARTGRKMSVPPRRLRGVELQVPRVTFPQRTEPRWKN